VEGTDVSNWMMVLWRIQMSVIGWWCCGGYRCQQLDDGAVKDTVVSNWMVVLWRLQMSVIGWWCCGGYRCQ
jgi:hypothetical protein